MDQTKRQKLVNALRGISEELKKQLSEIKNEAVEIKKRNDWLWHLLLTSMATMGNSRGYAGLIETHENYNKIKFDVLAKENDTQRAKTLNTVLKKAKVRMPQTKSRWLAENFNIIESEGGIIKQQEELLARDGKKKKIKFLQKFKGIGDKYARNMMMEICHPDFIDSIAIDERIKDVSESLGILPAPPSYDVHEKYYLDIANEVEITPWELDRLLYNNKDYFLDAMK